MLLIGGLFAQFSLDSSGTYVVDQAGLQMLPAVQLAINRINNKSDGIYDDLLPRTKVLHTYYFACILYCMCLLCGKSAYFCHIPARVTG